MGALRGSITVRRYLVTDPLPTDARKKLVRGLRAHAFTPIDPKSDLSVAVGWVSILDSEATDLDASDVLFVASGGEQLRIAMRVDVLKPGSAEVRRQLESRARLSEGERGRALSRRERRELKEEIIRELRQRTLPRIRTFDVVWSLESGRLYLWSQTKSVNEHFLELFARSFAARIVVEGPAVWARATAEAPTLERLMPTPELTMGFSGVRPLTSGTVEDT